MKDIKSVIEKSYLAKLGEVYKAFDAALLMAGESGEDIAAAEYKFKAGIDHAKDVRARALAIVEND